MAKLTPCGTPAAPAMGSQLRVTGRNGAGAAGLSPGPGPGEASGFAPPPCWSDIDRGGRTRPGRRLGLARLALSNTGDPPTTASDTSCWGTGRAREPVPGQAQRFLGLVVALAGSLAQTALSPLRCLRRVTGRLTGAPTRSGPSRHRTHFGGGPSMALLACPGRSRDGPGGDRRKFPGRTVLPTVAAYACGDRPKFPRFRTAVGDGEAWLPCPQHRTQPRSEPQGRIRKWGRPLPKSLSAGSGSRSGSACPWVCCPPVAAPGGTGIRVD